MARSPNCTGAPTYRGRVDVSISYPDPYEPPLLDPPEALPTSEPTTAQIEITITSAMLPVWSPYELEHVKTAILYAAGKNTSGATRTVYYRILKNGVNIATGSGSTVNGDNYTYTHYNFLDVNVGDVLGCKLWANGVGCNWAYKSAIVVPTRCGPAATLVHNMVVAVVRAPALTRGSPSALEAYSYLFHADEQWITLMRAYTQRHAACFSAAQSRLFRSGAGDVGQTSDFRTSQTAYPYYRQPIVLSHICYTPLNLRV